MIIIYDFDGTLTPYSLPQYPVIKKCGYNDEMLMARIQSEMQTGVDFYNAYWNSIQKILLENHIPFTRENFCMEANLTKLNNGVLEYFEKFKSSNTGMKHYIVTSGLQDYVEETPINTYVNGIFGITYSKSNNIFQDIEFLLTDKKKVDIIQKIQRDNNNTSDITYFGDGLTDAFAFHYVHSIGGKTVFVANSEKSKQIYKKINTDGIIDKYFEADFGEQSKIYTYIESLI